MFTLLTLGLWMGGLVAVLAGHLALGACIAAAGVVFAPKALAKPDDMQTAFGIMLLFVLVVGAIRLGAALLP